MEYATVADARWHCQEEAIQAVVHFGMFLSGSD